MVEMKDLRESAALPDIVAHADRAATPVFSSFRHRGCRATTSLVQVVLLAFAFYIMLLPVVQQRLNPLTGDEPFYVMTAISLVRDQDLDEANNYARRDYKEFYPPDPLPAAFRGWPGFPRTLPPHPATSTLPGLHTKHGIGLSVLIALPYQLFGRIGADLVIMVCAALLTGQMFLLARESAAPIVLAQLVALGLAIAMPIGPYATLIFPEIPAGLLLVYAVRRLAAPTNTPSRWLMTGVAISFLPWLHQRFAPTAVVLTLFVVGRVLRGRHERSMLLALPPLALGGASLLVYNQWLYGIPLQRTEDHAGFNHIAGTVNGAMGLLLDAQWGLLIVAPLMALAIAAVPWWYRASRRAMLIACVSVLPYLVVVSAYKVWWGEWGPAARYLVPIVPFAAGPLGAWLARATPRGRAIAAVFWAAGMLLAVVGYRDPQRFYHQPDGVNHLYQQVGDRLHISVQTWLVAFQPYALSPFPERLWISLFFILSVVLAMNAIGAPVLEGAGYIAARVAKAGRASVEYRGRHISVALLAALAVAFTVVVLVPVTLATRSRSDRVSLVVPTGGERIIVPFVNGRIGTMTKQSYGGRVSITVSGSGKAAATQESDAFYIFTDTRGRAKPPEHVPDFSIWINGRPADESIEQVPAYRSDHVYTIVIQVSRAPINLAIGDALSGDNTGAFEVVLAPIP